MMPRATKNTVLRILCAVTLVLCMLCSLLGCAYKQIQPDDSDLTVVGQVSGKDVYLEELRFVANTYRQVLIEKYGEDCFTGENAQEHLAELRQLVCANVTASYASLLLCEEVLIKLGDPTVLQKVDSTIAEEVKRLGGMGKYKKFLEENCLTDHLYRYLTEISILENELMYVYVDDIGFIEDEDDKIYDIIKDDFRLVRHVFVSHETEGAREKIDLAAARLEGGESFESVLSELGEDPDMTADGYFILKNYMTKPYEDAAYSLYVGKRSAVVEDENGYFIIELLETTPLDIMAKFDYLKDLYQSYTFYELIDQKQATLTFIPNRAGEDFFKDPFSK